MGEVVVSIEGGMELEFQETELKTQVPQPAENNNQKEKAPADGGGGGGGLAAEDSSSVVRWEKFLPKLGVRVLLVEADDSTRQIIAALLRKCSYKVAAVSDGLKAWEVLKAKSQSIDLILAEVQLPSISGYALLSLITVHDMYKNIPVIMMSSNDSVSTVYKCMLRGAVDFLVKPVRKNELRNLWQHIWRRQILSSTGPPEESTGPQKVEATAENNAASNHSSGYMACVQRNRDCIEKGSDAQSSCTKPEMETERDLQNNEVPENPSRQAIDLIGAFDSYRKGNVDSPALKASTNKFDSLPLLDLSLRRSQPSGSVNQINDETHRLNHSDASAFSRYINKPLQPRNSISSSTCNQQKDHRTNSDKQQSNQMARIQSGLPEATLSYPLQGAISQPIPVRNPKFENVINGFGIGTLIPQIYRPQSGHSFPHLNPFYHSDNRPSSSHQIHNILDQRISVSIDTSEKRQAQKVEKSEEKEDDSPGNDQSGSSGFYCGNINSISVGKAISDAAGEEGFHGTSHRSMQREAALTKFRMKRKDRCFEKKVRYESRKKLAEQRPRVKGQFVRQQSTDLQPQQAICSKISLSNFGGNN